MLVNMGQNFYPLKFTTGIDHKILVIRSDLSNYVITCLVLHCKLHLHSIYILYRRTICFWMSSKDKIWQKNVNDYFFHLEKQECTHNNNFSP